MISCDAIAVGGGPAGSAFAIELARSGRRVVIIEKTSQAHHKVCGDFISADSIALLGYLGLDVFAHHASRTGRLRLVSGGVSANSRLPFPAAALSRRRMDDALLAIAASHDVKIIRGETAKEISATTDGVIVRTAAQNYSCRDAAVATGKHVLPGISRPVSRTVGFKTLLELEPQRRERLRGQVFLMAYEHGYQGAQLVEDGQASVCWIVDRSKARELGRDWCRHMMFLSQSSSHLADLFAGSLPLLPRPVAVSGMPFGYIRPNAVSERIYAVGDQLATIPPFAGDGIAIALGSGVLAARSILTGGNPAQFQEYMKRRLKNQFQLARPAHALMTYPPTQKAGIGVLKRFPGLMAWIAAATRFDAATVVSN